jgi:hypothetical protein
MCQQKNGREGAGLLIPSLSCFLINLFSRDLDTPTFFLQRTISPEHPGALPIVLFSHLKLVNNMKRKKTYQSIFPDLSVPLYLIGTDVPSLLQDAAPDGVNWIQPHPEKTKKQRQTDRNAVAAGYFGTRPSRFEKPGRSVYPEDENIRRYA